MRVIKGDTVIHRRSREVGIVERRDGNHVVLRWPERNGQRETIARNDVQCLAEVMAEARQASKLFSTTLSLTGTSTLADLVSRFGYSTGQMRSESLRKVRTQLQRAGLQLDTEDDNERRDSRFWLTLLDFPSPDESGPDVEPSQAHLRQVALPALSWPQAVGLASHREVALLRALTEREPLLCVLHLSDAAADGGWLQATWEALMTWAYRSAQRFVRRSSTEFDATVLLGTSALLQTHLAPSSLDTHTGQMQTEPRSLNLITVRRDAELPVDFERLKASWPGPLFEFFSPEGAGELEGSRRAIEEVLYLLGGMSAPSETHGSPRLSPVRLAVWARESAEQLLARGSACVGDVFSRSGASKLKGSTEGETSLALKALLADWLLARDPQVKLTFEVVEGREEGDRRIDLVVEEQGHFEVESLRGSGPMEHFIHQKVFARRRDKPFTLVVPNDALLWAGPYLADVAFHLGAQGRVLVPGAEHVWLQLEGIRLAESASEVEPPGVAAAEDFVPEQGRSPSVETLKLNDIAGYAELRQRIDRQVIWPERHSRWLRGISRSPGILFFGPPGCGKSRMAKAIAGELEQEVRLLAPSDLRGEYIGWGQIRVREQFNWLAERERRMLVIDEFDAIARSRRGDQMHSDDKSTVNELLVQLDKVTRLGRIVVATTNHIDALDDAVLRTGRFGSFVPVGPPDLAAAGEILDFYLQRFARVAAEQPHLRVSIPTWNELLPLLSSLMSANASESRAFSCSDLEAAVNHVVMDQIRVAIEGRSSGGQPAINVSIPANALIDALQSGPRSIRPEALEGFEDEKARYCGR
ncbi:Cell division protein FtsH [Myxococcus hansupus]|uniref:Cell division protein FtsH n=1 Tax=Pseudomyxococcus hansupus TaxID=1297742 RepID=A0A0H4WTB6_9BACT|nr:ATP-binding protein [Myxococcus hansupus]AKQ64560.1 Cell division protein FtsH [Myxococcus hansupus]